MSWLYSQALVGASLGENSLAGEPYAPSNGTPTPQAFLCSDKTTAAWTRFPSGMTCKPLTADHGEALLMLYRAGFHAPTYHGQILMPKALEEGEVGYGGKWQELFVKWSLDSSSWKTHQCLWEEVLPESSVILPRWGMMRDGELLADQTLEPPLFENAYGLWPTPCAAGGETGGPVGLGGGTAARAKLLELCETEEEAKALGCGKTNPCFAEWLLAWPINWTSIEPKDFGRSATDKYQEWLRWHGISSARPLPTDS
jgi:hypothetical protein